MNNIFHMACYPINDVGLSLVQHQQILNVSVYNFVHKSKGRAFFIEARDYTKLAQTNAEVTSLIIKLSKHSYLHEHIL